MPSPLHPTNGIAGGLNNDQMMWYLNRARQSSKLNDALMSDIGENYVRSRNTKEGRQDYTPSWGNEEHKAWAEGEAKVAATRDRPAALAAMVPKRTPDKLNFPAAEDLADASKKLGKLKVKMGALGGHERGPRKLLEAEIQHYEDEAARYKNAAGDRPLADANPVGDSTEKPPTPNPTPHESVTRHQAEAPAKPAEPEPEPPTPTAPATPKVKKTQAEDNQFTVGKRRLTQTKRKMGSDRRHVVEVRDSKSGNTFEVRANSWHPHDGDVKNPKGSDPVWSVGDPYGDRTTRATGLTMPEAVTEAKRLHNTGVAPDRGHTYFQPGTGPAAKTATEHLADSTAEAAAVRLASAKRGAAESSAQPPEAPAEKTQQSAMDFGQAEPEAPAANALTNEQRVARAAARRAPVERRDARAKEKQEQQDAADTERQKQINAPTPSANTDPHASRSSGHVAFHNGREYFETENGELHSAPEHVAVDPKYGWRSGDRRNETKRPEDTRYARAAVLRRAGKTQEPQTSAAEPPASTLAGRKEQQGRIREQMDRLDDQEDAVKDHVTKHEPGNGRYFTNLPASKESQDLTLEGVEQAHGDIRKQREALHQQYSDIENAPAPDSKPQKTEPEPPADNAKGEAKDALKRMAATQTSANWHHFREIQGRHDAGTLDHAAVPEAIAAAQEAVGLRRMKDFETPGLSPAQLHARIVEAGRQAKEHAHMVESLDDPDNAPKREDFDDNDEYQASRKRRREDLTKYRINQNEAENVRDRLATTNDPTPGPRTPSWSQPQKSEGDHVREQAETHYRNDHQAVIKDIIAAKKEENQSKGKVDNKKRIKFLQSVASHIQINHPQESKSTDSEGEMESVGGGFKPQIDTAGTQKLISDGIAKAGGDPEATAKFLRDWLT
jgi:hypothetical protein